MPQCDVNLFDAESKLPDYVNQRYPNSLLYSSQAYLKFVARYLNAQIGLVTCQYDSQTNFIPFLLKSGDYGPVVNSLPYYGSNGGICGNDPCQQVEKALIEAFYAFAKEQECVSATIINNPLLADEERYQRYAAADFIDQRIGQITPLPESCEALMQVYHRPRPQNIRKAIKQGIEIRCSQSGAAMEFLYATHKANMEAIGGLAKSAAFFNNLQNNTFGLDWKIYTAHLNGVSVAALLLFYHNKTVEYFTPTIVEEHRSTQALSLCIFQAMQDAITQGYRNWNWGGTWINQGGVYDFKKRWGSQDHPYYYFTRVFNNGIKALSSQQILCAYPNFYVLPFSALEQP